MLIILPYQGVCYFFRESRHACNRIFYWLFLFNEKQNSIQGTMKTVLRNRLFDSRIVDQYQFLQIYLLERNQRA